MAKFLVNDTWVESPEGSGGPALDFIRGSLGLKGTKEGCREGDCGACAVLVGETGREGSVYRALPSCLLALGDLHGKHLVTIEGLKRSSGDPDGLTPVMRAFLEENASQCGFCTPGFIVALTAWLCAPGPKDLAGAMAAVDGNLCRCTGYGSIRRAAERLAREFADLPEDRKGRLEALVGAGVLPGSVLAFAAAAAASAVADAADRGRHTANPSDVILGGGTDYFVRNPDTGEDFEPLILRSRQEYRGFRTAGGSPAPRLEIGAAVTAAEFFASPEVRAAVPGIEAFKSQFASGLVRNLATIGGNLANASPVGDLSAILLALGAVLVLGAPGRGAAAGRILPLGDFFLSYKKTALTAGEAILAVRVPLRTSLKFSFAKIAKRGNLDIAAVNSALAFAVEGGKISGPRLSVGGAAPLPLSLERAAAPMEGFDVAGAKPAALADLAREVAALAAAEVAPIGDVRGSAAYRSRMTERLVLYNFMNLFKGSGIAEELYP
ncbi:MAG: FAD binding domain-containing protein [Spirochaetes bacterium]|nr:FAD binding domain-containing protein [Spirochaetota bacterium]